jgi:hypothetical protein
MRKVYTLGERETPLMDNREERTWTPQHRPGEKPDKEPPPDAPKPKEPDKK